MTELERIKEHPHMEAVPLGLSVRVRIVVAAQRQRESLLKKVLDSMTKYINAEFEEGRAEATSMKNSIPFIFESLQQSHINNCEEYFSKMLLYPRRWAFFSSGIHSRSIVFTLAVEDAPPDVESFLFILFSLGALTCYVCDLGGGGVPVGFASNAYLIEQYNFKIADMERISCRRLTEEERHEQMSSVFDDLRGRITEKVIRKYETKIDLKDYVRCHSSGRPVITFMKRSRASVR